MSNGLAGYLKGLKRDFTAADGLTVVMGNEAADLDSIVSAVCYAWFLAERGADALGAEAADAETPGAETPVYPLINIPRADFRLRSEAVYLFGEAGIDAELLFFAEDIDAASLAAAGKLKLYLVDHNRLQAPLEHLESCITGIIDHHADEGAYPPGAAVDIRPVGSAATIVAGRFLEKMPGLIGKPMGTLLLGTILLDTVNLDPAAGRVTPEDSAAAGALAEKAGIDSGRLFRVLWHEKYKEQQLGVFDLLRKDYKEWQIGKLGCGISSVHQRVQRWFEEKADLEGVFAAFSKEKGLDVLLVMMSFNDPEFTRQLIVFIPESRLRKKTSAFLEKSELRLQRMSIPDNASYKTCIFYDQKNPLISRKKLYPLLKDFLSKQQDVGKRCGGFRKDP